MAFIHRSRPGPPKLEVSDAVLRYPVGPFSKGSIKSNLFDLFSQSRVGDTAPQYITALDGVSISILPGDRVGVVGHNGAGKSTLLRAMAGVYPLESGTITAHGRLQTLFNIDIGFEVESTGRENILYRGLAMGVEPNLIRQRESEIINFASIGKFIDLPMRTYSTGMAVRLAFAITSYLDGDILLIDEVFGAGDVTFQKKAFKRMEAMINGAQIVVFVSHDLHTMQLFCNRLLWLDQGHLVMDGDPDSVVRQYLERSR